MKLAGLLRVSSEDRETMGSIETQRDKIDKWADVHDHTITAWFPDEDVSGMVPLELRPHGGRLLREAPEGRFEGVAVYRLDRLGRSFKVIFDALDALERLNLHFVSATENFDTVSPSGRAMMGMLATFAGFERDTFLQRTGDGKVKWAQAGCWLGGIVPYGYTLSTIEDRRFLVPSEEILDGCRWSESEVIRQMYHWLVEEQLSSGAIARRLIALGVPIHSRLPADRPGMKRKGVARGNWQPSKIRQMVANPTYKGTHVFGGKRGQKIPAQVRRVAGIVAEDLWDQAQRQMEKNREQGGRPTGAEYLLKGLLICSHCGSRYIGTCWPYGKRTAEGYHYYKCGGKHASYSVGTEYLKAKGCRNRALSGAEWEGKVWEDVVYVVTHADEVMERMQAAQPSAEAARAGLQERLDAIARHLGDLDQQERTLIALAVRGRLTDAQFDAEQDRINTEKHLALAERGRYRDAVANLEEIAVDEEGTRQALGELAEWLAGAALTFAERRYVVRRLIKRIEVDAPTTPGRSPNPPPAINIVWRVKAILVGTCADTAEYCFPLGMAA